MTESRLRTLRDHIRWAVSRFHGENLFFGHGTDNAWDEARQLVLGAVHLPFEIADAYLDCVLEEDERAHLQQLLKRRIDERVPTAYLLGEAWFCGLPFTVDERVLVPRSPIGELIGHRFDPWLPADPARILDLCCGSGCIGISQAGGVLCNSAADKAGELGSGCCWGTSGASLRCCARDTGMGSLCLYSATAGEGLTLSGGV